DGSVQRYEPSPYGYALAHFAREVVPGSVRVEASSADPLVRVSAYRRPDGGWAFVLINNRSASVAVNLSLRNATLPASLRVRTSTASRMWQIGASVSATNGSLTLTLPSRSLTTVAP
ncbi:MAG: hypothetical protein LC737_05835, partial [Chloroflexi bacterium]|nr:hypothetical protein [Chloroflexota bacterium]